MKAFILISMFVLQGFACVWLDGTTIDGEYRSGVMPGGLGMEMEYDGLREALRSSPMDRAYRYEQEFNLKEDDNLSKAVIQLLKGNYKESIEQLHMEEQREPGRYEVAVNLGTAYELAGENAKALEWIQEGIRRNPNAHYGTEWLHEMILKMKLFLEDEPELLKSRHVIPLLDHHGNTIQALFYQLRERMLFVKPKDEIVADLLYNYAVLNAEDRGFLEYSMELLELAQQYGYANKEQLEQKKEEYQKIIDEVTLIENAKIWGYIALFVLLLVIAYKKKWLFLSRREQQEHRDQQLKAAKQKGGSVKSKLAAYGRLLVVVTPLLAFLLGVLANNLAVAFILCIAGWLIAYIMIRDGKAYEAELNKEEEN